MGMNVGRGQQLCVSYPAASIMLAVKDDRGLAVDLQLIAQNHIVRAALRRSEALVGVELLEHARKRAAPSAT
jgi:hypothetical protein